MVYLAIMRSAVYTHGTRCRKRPRTAHVHMAYSKSEKNGIFHLIDVVIFTASITVEPANDMHIHLHFTGCFVSCCCAPLTPVNPLLLYDTVT